ncbi:MAG: glucose-6-phosphate isomerase [Hyphomonadaceae bacterium]|nr:glucose-6-phosphate isomerase [Hyphomonadaceae bacterium]
MSGYEAREAAWTKLEAHAADLAKTPLKALFEADAERTARFTKSAAGVTVDLSRQRLTGDTLKLFLDLAREADVSAKLAAMGKGEIVNPTEGRAALHVALRGSGSAVDARASVDRTRGEVKVFAHEIATGKRQGAGGPFKSIVHIGIGGSDLGPRFLYDALKRFRRPGMTMRFAANVDGAEIADALEGLDPATTLVVVVSKTFTTQETMANADAARAWLIAAIGEAKAKDHVVAVSAAPDRAKAWGAGAVFPFWDWVGGRYSLWSAVGLSCEIGLVDDAFQQLLDGAAAMDAHVFETPLPDNLAFRAACVQSLNRLYGMKTYALIPYGRRLQLLPAFLQQLEMESNGKGVDAEGRTLKRSSAAVTWGDAGTNAQHSFFQLLHQGRDVTPVEFLLIERGSEGPASHRNMLLANVLAQAQALYEGKTEAAAKQELLDKGETPKRAAELAPHRAFTGDRPSTMIGLDALTPKTLGALLAFYEHRTVLQAWLAGVNPFDQWGVELGKQMAAGLLPALQGDEVKNVDPATKAWVEKLR